MAVQCPPQCCAEAVGTLGSVILANQSKYQSARRQPGTLPLPIFQMYPVSPIGDTHVDHFRSYQRHDQFKDRLQQLEYRSENALSNTLSYRAAAV